MENSVTEGMGVPVSAPEAIEAAHETCTSPHNPVDALRRVHAFADLPVEQLEWFIANSEERFKETGEILFKKGDPPEWMAVYLEGESHAYRNDDAHDDFIYVSRAGDPASEVTGMLPFSRMTTFGATGRAVTPLRMLAFPVRLFPELMQRMPVLVQRLVGIMSDRVRETTKADQQRDKLMALGKLSAGLAHELNNPAAGASRAANELIEVLKELRGADLRLCRHTLNKEQSQAIDEFEEAALEQTSSDSKITSLEQSDREEQVGAWLEEHGVEDAWKLTGNLVDAGIDDAKLEALLGVVEISPIADVLARINAQLSAAKLAIDIRTSTGRISELVGAIKEYSYMDQASVQEIDIHKGLDNTLLILKYKLRKKNISVIKEYGEDLPKIRAYGSELNQVWTNLIVNAVEAMNDGGTLKVRTKREPSDILVEIRDNGEGIPEDARAHIFEPFYTTKPVGEGTGLGLDTVARIVRKHRGNIRVESKPGDTCFQVRLPTNGSNSGSSTVH